MTTSDALGEGKTENAAVMRSGYSSRGLSSKSDPTPPPVPPLKEYEG